MIATRDPIPVDVVAQAAAEVLTTDEKDVVRLALIRLHRTSPELVGVALEIARKLAIEVPTLTKAASAVAGGVR